MTKIVRPYVIAITGASAQPVAERAIQLLLDNNQNVALILSKGAYEVWNSEMSLQVPVDMTLQEKFWRSRLKVKTGQLKCFKWNNHAASIASGSYKTKGMIIIPCTMGTVGRLASGYSLDLIERTADVHLKENRPLIIAPRETPFNLIHLKNMTTLSTAGVTIFPLIPAWYTKPNSINDIIDFLVIRLFDLLGEDLGNINRWGEK